MSQATPTLAQVIRAAVQAHAADLRVAIPASVERVDLAKGLVDARPLVKDLVGDAGSLTPLSMPVITNVPVVWPGAGGFRLTFPIATGDTVLLVFSDRSLDVWLAKGGEVDPGDPRRHALSDAIAIPGLRPFSDPWAGAAADGVTLGQEGGTQVRVKAGTIELGGADEPAAMATTLKGYLDQVKIWLDALVLPTAVGPAGPPSVPSPVVPTIASSIVMVKS